MKRKALLFLGFILILTGCNTTPDYGEKKLNQRMHTQLSEYIESVELVDSRFRSKERKIFDIKVKANDYFEELSLEEKFNVVYEAVTVAEDREPYTEDEWLSCGDVECTVDSIIFESRKDRYAIKLFEGISPHHYEMWVNTVQLYQPEEVKKAETLEETLEKIMDEATIQSGPSYKWNLMSEEDKTNEIDTILNGLDNGGWFIFERSYYFKEALNEFYRDNPYEKTQFNEAVLLVGQASGKISK